MYNNKLDYLHSVETLVNNWTQYGSAETVEVEKQLTHLAQSYRINLELYDTFDELHIEAAEGQELFPEQVSLLLILTGSIDNSADNDTLNNIYTQMRMCADALDSLTVSIDAIVNNPALLQAAVEEE